MTLLKSIPVIILLAIATTPSPPPRGVRDRIYGSSFQSRVNHLAQQKNDHEVMTNSDSENGSWLISRSPEVKGRQAQDSHELHMDAKDYFDPDFWIRKIPRRDRVRSREDSNRPGALMLRKVTSSHGRRRRPGNLHTNPTGSRNEGEFGYNYQGGTGDVQIHQHIHEYVFSGGGTMNDFGDTVACCNGNINQCCNIHHGGYY